MMLYRRSMNSNELKSSSEWADANFYTANSLNQKFYVNQKFNNFDINWYKSKYIQARYKKIQVALLKF